MSQLPEHQAYKTLPAGWASSLSFQIIKPALLNKPYPWASSLQNPPCSMSQLPYSRANKTDPVQWTPQHQSEV